jgi:hypothetical protein
MQTATAVRASWGQTDGGGVLLFPTGAPGTEPGGAAPAGAQDGTPRRAAQTSSRAAALRVRRPASIAAAAPAPNHQQAAQEQPAAGAAPPPGPFMFASPGGCSGSSTTMCILAHYSC